MNISTFQKEIKEELYSILRFWSENTVDEKNKGFIGRIDNKGKAYLNSEKGAVLNARILWTFSAAVNSNILENKENSRIAQLANRSFQYFVEHFIDRENGGVFWSLNSSGKPRNKRKQIYAIAFAIYGLSEYYKMSQFMEAKNQAISLFKVIELHSFDMQHNGYFEAFAADWSVLEDVRLSEKDRNDPKTMNTHLHILEAYNNLYEIWPNKLLKSKIENLLFIFETQIFCKKTKHLRLFFDQKWNSKSTTISFGHDIEAAWLLLDAAIKIKNNNLILKWKSLSIELSQSTLEGLQPDGSLIHKYDPESGEKDKHREWWVSAEAMVGFMNSFQLNSNQADLEIVFNLWSFIKKNLLDKIQGEWFWGVTPKKKGIGNYELMEREDKVGFWKCPYHNARSCIELLNRINSLSYLNNTVS